MKKRIVTLLLAGAMTTALLTGCGGQGNTAGTAQNNAADNAQAEGNAAGASEGQANAADSQAGENAQNGNENTQNNAGQSDAAQNGTASAITEEQAKAIALEKAGITEADTIAIAVKQERDDGVSIYNVDIYTADRDYEYDVAVADGTIYSQESEPVERITSTNVNTGVSLDEAKNALLAKVPGAADKNLRISLDRDDGRYNYEGEIIYGDKSYEYEMNAETGDIYEWSEELLNR